MKHDKLMTAMTSSEHHDWATPPNFVRFLEHYFYLEFDLDAAADIFNTKAPIFFSKAENSLFQNWFGNVWLKAVPIIKSKASIAQPKAKLRRLLIISAFFKPMESICRARSLCGNGIL